MNSLSFFSPIKVKFRYNLKQLIKFERDPQIQEQKSRTIIILMIGFIVYSLITIIPVLDNPFYHGIITNISIAIHFSIVAVYTKKTKNHIIATITGSYMLCSILFIHFITETDWTIGMDAFWLFILIMPFITDYLAGIFYGSISALSGLILSILLFFTPLNNYLQPYGDNMINWFSIIYIVGMFSAAIIEYELTAFQIEKFESDAKIAYYQSERANRLKEQLSIYESNEQTIRKYKHDIRHFNRVLAGLIQDKKYEEATSYLNEFDSMLEHVTAVSFCDNQIVNELLTIYSARCQKLGFKLRAKAIVPEKFPIEDTDLTSLLANALENAYEAQAKIEDVNQRQIQVDIAYDGRKLKLLTKNTCNIQTVFRNNGLPESSRIVKSGIGTTQIKNIAEKYSGVASFIQDKDTFVVRVIMTCM